MYDINATFYDEERKVEGAYPIDMFILNASQSGWSPLYYTNLNQDIVGYTLNATGDIQSATTTYTGLPINREDISSNIQGEIDGLTISIPNIDRAVESIIQDQDYLRGKEIFVVTMFAKHLPSGTGIKFIGEDPDKNSAMTEKYYIDSTVSNEDVVTFSCKSKFDIKKITIPGRTFDLDCHWALKGRYLGSECDLEGNINSASFPTCDGTLDNCRERHNEKRYGGFPSIPKRGIYIT